MSENREYGIKIEHLKNKSNILPSDVYGVIFLESNAYSFLLESAELGEKIARYSFIGAFPEKIITIKNRTAKIKSIGSGDGNEGKKEIKIADPLDFLRKEFERARIKIKNSFHFPLPSFVSGFVGYFAYDIIRYYEDIGSYAEDELNENDAEFILATNVIIFDHWRNEILIAYRDEDAKNQLMSYLRKAEKVRREGIKRGENKDFEVESAIEIEEDEEKQKFLKAVEKAKKYIYDGDIFQVVLSKRFEKRMENATKKDIFNIYLALRALNPSPYMFFLDFDNTMLIGSSPEVLARVKNRKVIVRPIAGTRKRGRDIVEDEELLRELLNDEKERAEHLMLVDLGRNDVGKVAKFGSVKVTDFFAVEKYSHVQHLVSNVEGELEDSEDAFSAFISCFPAGTVSGAPKIRAMQIIEELEGKRRGIYSGAVGYFDFSGNADFAITIRTIVIHKSLIKGKPTYKAYVQAGAGIVYDSKPEKEYKEIINKSKAMLKAIEIATARYESAYH